MPTMNDIKGLEGQLVILIDKVEDPQRSYCLGVIVVNPDHFSEFKVATSLELFGPDQVEAYICRQLFTDDIIDIYASGSVPTETSEKFASQYLMSRFGKVHVLISTVIKHAHVLHMNEICPGGNSLTDPDKVMAIRENLSDFVEHLPMYLK